VFRAEDASPLPVSPSLIRAQAIKVSDAQQSGLSRGGSLWLLPAVDSTVRCNAFAEHLSGRMEAERFARPLV
jgi:hypothetical protein